MQALFKLGKSDSAFRQDQVALSQGDSSMWKYYLSLGAVLGWVALGHTSELPDLGKLDRTILKEPTYTAKQPLYGLLVFGPKADKRVWIVLDKSKPDAACYDILYVDRNA